MAASLHDEGSAFVYKATKVLMAKIIMTRRITEKTGGHRIKDCDLQRHDRRLYHFLSCDKSLSNFLHAMKIAVHFFFFFYK